MVEKKPIYKTEIESQMWKILVVIKGVSGERNKLGDWD